MPRFSVIVPAFGVQAYLRECLDSVLTQSFTDLELLAVDDCSPDLCGQIIDEAAAGDPRVTPIHLPRNVGLGGARNAGLERACGEYVLFLDGDDTLAAGSLEALAVRLKDVGEPDVLVFDHVQELWDGSLVPDHHAALLERSAARTFRTSDRPSILRLLPVVWNKAYRRDFIERNGFSFPDGLYEDVPWTYPVMAEAATVATLPRVCVRYRKRRHGSIVATTSRAHLDIFDQYDRVFAFFDAHPEHVRVRAWVYARMLDHFTTVLTTGRLPRSAGRAFLRRARAHHRRHRRIGRIATSVRTRLRRALLGLGSPVLFGAAWSAVRWGERARAELGRAVRTAHRAWLWAYYRVQRLLPVDHGMAVFTAYWGRGYTCNPAAIEAKARELVPGLRTAWIAAREYADTIPPGVQRIEPGSAGFWRALARAGCLVANVNLHHRYRKRRGQVNVQTHHGTPLKTMGVDLSSRPGASAGTDFDRLLRHADRWDYSLSANPYSTAVWERAYPAAYKTLEYGYPRNDVLCAATDEDRERARAVLGIAPETTVVLYAPTHRDHESGFAPRLDLDRVARRLGPGFVLLLRAHYFYSGAIGTRADNVLDVSAHPRVEDLCIASDVLVTDYSSIAFDYAHLDRPIVIHADDWEIYRAVRGTYFDITAEPPGPVTRTEDELVHTLTQEVWNCSESSALRAAFIARFCPHTDGRSAERVVRRVFLGQTDPVPGKASSR